MLAFLWRASVGYRLTPWRSPYLRWRIETYSGLHADQIGRAAFFRFCSAHQADLWRFLKWAARMRRS